LIPFVILGCRGKTGAVRIASGGNLKNISTVAFRGQNGEKILQVVNSNETDLAAAVSYNNQTAAVTLSAISISIFIWQ